MRQLVLLWFSVLILWGCQDDAGEPLFDLIYPPESFEISAGRNPIVSDGFAFPNLQTRFTSYLNDNNRSVDEITQILPQSARLISNDGQDFSFLDQVSVRICPNTGEQCDQADEVFYSTDLYRRRWETIQLDPGLRNVKDLLSGEEYRLEVVLTYGEITPYSMSCRLEYSFRAYQ
ncbi:MAG: hypothetical protein D6772_02005 [Bacteroidetes bacterium]|nr:MAG: hypothetical protein D6772_02005 [Bacteroidota bacterium]